MPEHISIREVLQMEPPRPSLTIEGWVRTFRNDQFIAVNDGSCHENLQVVIRPGQFEAALVKRITTGAAIRAQGELVTSIGRGQKVELQASQIEIVGDCNPEIYPLQPKKHSLEFLREHAHLRMRTQTFGAVFRIRHSLAYAIHHFFHQKGFLYLHTPIITASDAEGAGELFQVTTLDLRQVPINEQGEVDYAQDFFGRKANLTVSGQLEGELGALAFSRIYTFGPTFRAENSNTTRHLAEFWMIEPEMAFFDLHDNMDLAEEFIKYIIRFVLEQNAHDLQFLSNRQKEEESKKPQPERLEMELLEKLHFVVEHPFERISYTDAFEILKNSSHNKKKKFQFPVEQWGM
ncbi:MAG: asparagine--tRNA ligase, partial [Thermoflavifilum sp.]|nr:asparagine--tRNA ligase [Thermoflavifilum sp.]